MLTPSGGNQANPNVLISVDSAEVTVSNYSVIIQPSTPLDDRGTKTFSLSMPGGVIKDVGDHLFGGISGNTYHFTVNDTSTPITSSFIPLADAVSQPKDTDIKITFDEDIQAGTGYVVLTPSGGNQQNLPLIVTVSDAQISTSGATVTINPTYDLDDRGGKLWDITMGAGVFLDTTGNEFAGITASTYKFGVADSTPPLVSAYSPQQYAIGVLKGTNLVVTFNENIRSNSGNLVLTPSGGSGSNAPLLIDVTGSQVTFSLTQMTVDPTNDLDDRSNKTFTITAASGVIEDEGGNAFELSGDMFVFTTFDTTPPRLVQTIPVDGATTVLKTIAITLTYNEHLVVGHGNITLYISGGNGVNPPRVIPVNDGQVSIGGSVVTITPTAGLDDEMGKLYNFTIDSGAFQDVVGLVTSNITGDQYQFFVPDNTLPSIAEYSPLQAQINVNETTDVVLRFSESITKGSGSILLTPTGGGTTYELDVSSPHVTISGSTLLGASGPPTLTINFPTDLVPGKEYTVTFPSNFVQDLASPPNSVAALTSSTYVFQMKTKIRIQFVEQVNLQPVEGKIVFMSQGGITHINVEDTSSVSFESNAMTIRPDIVNQDATTKWVVIIGDGTVKDLNTGAKLAGVYFESAAYHVSREGVEFLFYTTFRGCSTCT